MSPSDRKLAEDFDRVLVEFAKRRPLPGISTAKRRSCLVHQLVDSTRRVRFVAAIRAQELHRDRADPDSDLFDPIRGAAVLHQAGAIDEASWLVFLSVHFGKAPRTAWQRVRDVYGALGRVSARWTWARTSANTDAFRRWLHANKTNLEGQGRRFGNHRKYESLDAYADRGTGTAIATYVSWVNPPRTHQAMFDEALAKADGDPRQAFAILYRSMKAVRSFGRMAKFDYLTMIGKLGLAAIEPGSTFLVGATGPRRAAGLLFGARSTKAKSKSVEEWLDELGSALNVGPQVIEDALCNWQKSPDRFVHFGG